jgi:hypothetical protein
MAGAQTVLVIREGDITPEVCERCAACCRISIQVPNMDARFRRFLRGVGFQLTPPPKEGADDCCDGVHATTVQLGPCRHLVAGEAAGSDAYRCALYADPRRPQLCADFNCVSWAKANNTYNLDNLLIVRAQETWSALRADTRRV